MSKHAEGGVWRSAWKPCVWRVPGLGKDVSASKHWHGSLPSLFKQDGCAECSSGKKNVNCLGLEVSLGYGSCQMDIHKLHQNEMPYFSWQLCLFHLITIYSKCFLMRTDVLGPVLTQKQDGNCPRLREATQDSDFLGKNTQSFESDGGPSPPPAYSFE